MGVESRMTSSAPESTSAMPAGLAADGVGLGDLQLDGLDQLGQGDELGFFGVLQEKRVAQRLLSLGRGSWLCRLRQGGSGVKTMRDTTQRPPSAPAPLDEPRSCCTFLRVGGPSASAW